MKQLAPGLAWFVAGLLTLCFVTMVTGAGVFRDRQPELALRFAWFDAGAKARLAERLVLEPLSAGRMPSAADRARARTLAVAALRRDPTAVPAAATLALEPAIAGDQTKADAQIVRVERLSRRYLPLQLWLLQRRVDLGDIPGALQRYDIAMRISRESRLALLPVLMAASDDPEIAARLKPILAAGPEWRAEFLTRLAWEGPSPVAIAQAAVPNLAPGNVDERRILSQALSRIVELGRPDLAWSAYARIVPGQGTVPLRNADFCAPNPMPPFEWRLAEGALTPDGCQQVAEAKAAALILPAAPDKAGEVAQQLLHLPAGSFRINATVGNVDTTQGTAPTITVRCVGPAAPGLLDQPFPQAPATGARLGAEFVVPAGCTFQWLSIVTLARSLDDPGAPWIANLQIEAGGNRPAAAHPAP